MSSRCSENLYIEPVSPQSFLLPISTDDAQTEVRRDQGEGEGSSGGASAGVHGQVCSLLFSLLAS